MTPTQPTPEPTRWTPERLQDRFDDIDRRFESVQHDIRAFGPVVGQVATASADVDAAERDIAALRDDFREMSKAMTTLVRYNRAEQLKYLAYIIGPTALLVAAVFLSGKAPTP